MKNVHDIIVAPHLTEAANEFEGERQKVTFKVRIDADKVHVRHAVEKIFDVKVDQVNIIRQRGKKKRLGRFIGQKATWKKAIVTLAEGYEINLYEAQ